MRVGLPPFSHTHTPALSPRARPRSASPRPRQTFFWAATPTCSNGLAGLGDEEEKAIQAGIDFIGPLLLSAEGLEGLVRAGELSDVEMEALLGSGLPPSQYAYVLLEWVGLCAMDGMQRGWLRSGAGLEDNLMRQLTGLRAEYFNIGDYASGRMPVAYVQLVEVLVDSLVLLAPFALYPELGSLTVPATGLLTLFFKGLLELSKSFLDPFGNEGYPGQNIRVDVLVSELNFGAASRWMKAGAVLPTGGDAAPDESRGHMSVWEQRSTRPRARSTSLGPPQSPSRRPNP